MQSTSTDEYPVPQVEFMKGRIVDIASTSPLQDESGYLIKDQNTSVDFIVEVTEGSKLGDTYTVYSNGYNYKIGDEVYLTQSILPGQESFVYLDEKIRLPEIYMSIIFFVVVVVLLFGKKGIKSIASLLVSFLIIFFVLIPLTLKGYNPILVASGISALLLTTMMLITNGRNQVTYSAIIGCVIAILITIILSYIVVEQTSITGKVDETWSYFNNYLNLNLNFSLIVIAGMIIGVIGAVDDGAITQASVVKQLKEASPNLTDKEYFFRAMQVGRDHAGAMVNTLVLAYAASSIPLLMLIYQNTSYPLYIMINHELVATEIFRATIGSIGLLLAIPITTFISVYLIKSDSKNPTLDTHTHSH